MEIEKEENIVVRYIPQYIVIETRYKPLQSYADPQEPVSKTVHNLKYENSVRIEPENASQGVHSDECSADDDVDHNEYAEFKIESFEIETDDGVSPKSSPTKRNCNSKSTRLLHEWFMGNLHVRPLCSATLR